jgi:hypothetical protein
MKHVASPRLKLIAVFTAVFLVTSLQPATAAVQYTGLTSSCTGYGGTTYLVWADPITISSGAVVSSVNYKYNGGNTPSGSYVKIYSDDTNVTSGKPLTVIGTLNYVSFSSNIATYTGSVTLPSAGRYWFALGSPTTATNPCYTTSIVTTGTANGWSIGGNSYESSNSGGSFGSTYTGYHFLFSIDASGGGLVSASNISISASGSAFYQSSVTVSATLGVAGTDGKVTFFANGKRISGCVSKQSVSLVATCTFKPSRRGLIAITAALKPTDTGYASSVSSPKNLLVGNRTTLR